MIVKILCENTSFSRVSSIERNSHKFWYLKENSHDIHMAEIDEFMETKLCGESIRRRNFKFEDPFVTVEDDVMVRGSQPIAFTSEGDVIKDVHCFAHGSQGLVYKRLGEYLSDLPQEFITTTHNRLDHISDNSSDPKRIDTGAILNYEYSNYYIWLVQEILKLRGIKYYENISNNSVDLILPESIPDYVDELLNILGYPQRNRYYWNREPLNVKNFVVTSYPEPTKNQLSWLKESVINNIETSEFAENWIYVSRQKTEKGRKVRNYSEFSEVLSKYGIDIVYCEEMSVEEQVVLFNSIDGVISPHGAGLTNIIWGNDLTVIELFNDVIQGPFYIISYILGYDYIPYQGDEIVSIKRKKDRDIFVDIEKFDSLMNEYFQLK